MTYKYIEISDSPNDLYIPFRTLFTKEALTFLVELFIEFDSRINQLYYSRCCRKYELKKSNDLPNFLTSKQRNDRSWKIRPVPKRFENRQLDLGDVSPANTLHFFDALNAKVRGVQVDFDDGHCPTWRNQIIGHYNVYIVVHNENNDIKPLKQLPVLMLRPRAWNMTEHNIMINGKKVPGALVDFAILMYHNGSILYEEDCGPCFYLSKLECAAEAKLWNDIFAWTQKRLNIPYGTIKACVLIENILSSFEMEEILFELKDHSLGLNCGIWDYSASIIAKFGHRKDFVLPDRNKYVNMQKHFLKKFMQLMIQICHSRGAHATGGMSAQIVTENKAEATIEHVITSKTFEINAGVDGFMVYDIQLVPHMNKLWEKMCGQNVNQFNILTTDAIHASDLLQMPTGGVTRNGLLHNIEVSILFIYNWLQGNGYFINKGIVEDSATAEISRSQIWQWIRHMTKIEDNGEIITTALIHQLTKDCVNKQEFLDKKKLIISAKIFLGIVYSPDQIDFITTYINDHYIFSQIHQNLLSSKYLQHKM